ncbi:MAG: hypothetical protein HYV32_05580 [Candidatus Kerfeldbacteria bacterium]|nr:hypothetical protein [Candidatus Kerfeldbacteria bacterium]
MFEQTPGMPQQPQPVPPQPQPFSPAVPMQAQTPYPLPNQNAGPMNVPVLNTTGAAGPGAIPGQGSPTPERVYTMPERFMPPKTGSARGGKKKLFLFIAIILFILVVVGVVVVFMLQQKAQPVQTNKNSNTPAQTNNTNTPSSVANANTNTNPANTNQPANQNANVGLNDNTNANANANTNLNANINGNTNTAINTNTPTNGEEVTDASDKDKDHLTDEEEKIYGTQSGLPDTDKDGYIDGTEVANLYSPTKANQSLLNSGLVIEEKNGEFSWKIDYPAQWLVESLNDSNSEIIFTPDTIEGEFVEVIVTENTKHQSAAQWYASLYSDITVDDLETTTVGGLEGIVVNNGLTYYLANDQYIIGIVYNYGTTTTIHFRTTFDMMVASFTYTAKSKNTNGNANNNSNNDNTNS